MARSNEFVVVALDVGTNMGERKCSNLLDLDKEASHLDIAAAALLATVNRKVRRICAPSARAAGALSLTRAPARRSSSLRTRSTRSGSCCSAPGVRSARLLSAAHRSSPEQPRVFATETKNPLFDEEVDEHTYTNIVVRPRPRSSLVRPARADRGARHVRWTGMFRRWTSTS